MVEELPDVEASRSSSGASSGSSSGEARPRPALPAAPATGDAVVDEAVASLADLPELPVDDHPAAFEIVHRALTDRLADVEG